MITQLKPAPTSARPQLSSTGCLPAPRGPLTEILFAALRADIHELPGVSCRSVNPLADEDLQLALYCCYELHYRGLPGVDDRWEWEPSLQSLVGAMERLFEDQLRSRLSSPPTSPEAVVAHLWSMTRGTAPSLSQWLLEHGTWEQARELAVHRSAYQLKEADPHTWAIPRLTGRAKAAMVTIQSDEYGGGVAARMHASLFADTMRSLGLDAAYGAYLDGLPAQTLATTNLITMLGLHRRLRGALVGHLAVFEMTSVGPMRRYAEWMRQLGVPTEGRAFYDVHVVADQVHQFVAADDLVGGLLEAEPQLASDVLFGAEALALVEQQFSNHLRACWATGRTSLRDQVAQCSDHRASFDTDEAIAAAAGVPFIGLTCGGTGEAELRDAGAVEVWRDPQDLRGNVSKSLQGENGPTR